jgi:hypothetical protein
MRRRPTPDIRASPTRHEGPMAEEGVCCETALDPGVDEREHRRAGAEAHNAADCRGPQPTARQDARC